MRGVARNIASLPPSHTATRCGTFMDVQSLFILILISRLDHHICELASTGARSRKHRNVFVVCVCVFAQTQRGASSFSPQFWTRPPHQKRRPPPTLPGRLSAQRNVPLLVFLTCFLSLRHSTRNLTPSKVLCAFACGHKVRACRRPKKIMPCGSNAMPCEANATLCESKGCHIVCLGQNCVITRTCYVAMRCAPKTRSCVPEAKLCERQSFALRIRSSALRNRLVEPKQRLVDLRSLPCGLKATPCEPKA